MRDLFESAAPEYRQTEFMAEGAMLLRGAALPFEEDLLPAVNGIVGRDDKLRSCRLGHGSDRLSL
jgi:alkylated DNA repair protein (DNA oxidative demethylase)